MTPRSRASVAWVAALAVATVSAVHAQPPQSTPERPTYLGRTIANVMSYHGASWLERPSRDQEEATSQLLGLLPIQAGDTVADLGCGSGYFARRMAERVGRKGRALCIDIQPEMLRIAEKLAADEGVENLTPVLASETDPHLPPGGVDLVLLVDVYHELQQPGPVLAAMRRALSPKGRVALVEYRAEDDSAAHILPDHRMSVAQVEREWLPAGFRLDRLIEDLPTQHLFLFAAAEGSPP